MKKIKRILLTAAVLITGVAMVLSGCSKKSGSAETGAAGAEQKIYKLRLAHCDPETDPLHLAAVEFKRIIEEKTKGQIQIEIFTNSTLGDQQTLVRSAGDGSIDLAIVSSSGAQASTPSVGAIMMPYMFTSSEKAWKVFDDVLPEMNKRMIKEGNVRVLCFYEKGFRVLTNSKKPVTKLSDLQGLKLRVTPSPIPLETFKSWGIEPIPMAWAEVFTALQQRVIDGQENPYTTIPAQKFWEVQKYVTEIHYMMYAGPLLLSEKTYQNLPVHLQKALEEAGYESAVWERNIHSDLTEQAKKEIVANGMVLCGAPEDEAEWQRRAQSLWPSLYDGAGGKEWVEYVLSLNK
jgi:tripartite ATP-independent transporter DctP family solute receptor